MTEQLAVFPNPWGVSPFLSEADAVRAHVAAYDADGQPTGLFVDHARIRESRVAWVGAEIASHVITHEVDVGEQIRSPRQRTAYRFRGVDANDEDLAGKLFAAGPVDVPMTPANIHGLRTGQLIAANARVARRVDIKPFASPQLFKHLANVHARLYRQERGDDALDNAVYTVPSGSADAPVPSPAVPAATGRAKKNEVQS